MVAGAKGTVKGAVEFVKSPIETGKDIIKGTGQFISNLGDSIFSDDPDQDNVVKTALGMMQLVRDNPSGKLKEINRGKLRDLSVNSVARYHFKKDSPEEHGFFCLGRREGWRPA